MAILRTGGALLYVVRPDRNDRAGVPQRMTTDEDLRVDLERLRKASCTDDALLRCDTLRRLPPIQGVVGRKTPRPVQARVVRAFLQAAATSVPNDPRVAAAGALLGVHAPTGRPIGSREGDAADILSVSQRQVRRPATKFELIGAYINATGDFVNDLQAVTKFVDSQRRWVQSRAGSVATASAPQTQTRAEPGKAIDLLAQLLQAAADGDPLALAMQERMAAVSGLVPAIWGVIFRMHYELGVSAGGVSEAIRESLSTKNGSAPRSWELIADGRALICGARFSALHLWVDLVGRRTADVWLMGNEELGLRVGRSLQEAYRLAPISDTSYNQWLTQILNPEAQSDITRREAPPLPGTTETVEAWKGLLSGCSCPMDGLPKAQCSAHRLAECSADLSRLVERLLIAQLVGPKVINKQ